MSVNDGCDEPSKFSSVLRSCSNCGASNVYGSGRDEELGESVEECMGSGEDDACGSGEVDFF